MEAKSQNMLRKAKNDGQVSIRERWEKATLADNFLFCKIMSNSPDICQELLETLLEIEIDHLEMAQSEKTMAETFDSKTVRFDVYAKNSTQVFDIEMQTTNNSNLAKRARYYQSVIDMDALQSGANYKNLKDSYVIFLCLSDVFKKKQPVYRFENTCVLQKNEIDGIESDKTCKDEFFKLDDGSHKIFFNADCCDKLENIKARNFFTLLKGGSADDDFSRKIEEKIARAKKNMDWWRQFMTWQQTIDEEIENAREELREEFKKEGRMEKSVETAEKLLKLNVCTIEQISQVTGLSVDEVRKIEKEIQ